MTVALQPPCEGLPKNHFPIKAVSGRVTQVMTKVTDGSWWQMDSSRYQLPFKLAFAITGHAAQGAVLVVEGKDKEE